MGFRYFLIGLTSLLIAVSTPALAIDRNGNYQGCFILMESLIW
jgi:hypothetical protein